MNEDFSFNYQATHILNIETNYKKPLFLEMVNTIKEDTDNNNLIPIDWVPYIPTFKSLTIQNVSAYNFTYNCGIFFFNYLKYIVHIQLS